MYLIHDQYQCTVHAPAKLNLLLEVLSKRSDEYYEILTLMAPISLFDTLTFRATPSGAIRLHCQVDMGGSPSGGGADEMPWDERNLVFQAVELLRRRAGVEQGAVVELTKRIPVAAGLGGGSSDAAAALAAANRAWKLNWSRSRLCELAAELGSDAPFFLADGAAMVGRGRGVILSPVDSIGRLHFVVTRPPEGLSTASVYANCQPAGPAQALVTERRLARLVAALRCGDLARAGTLFLNRLEQTAARISSWIDRLRYEYKRLGFLGHLMSGSGSSYFGFCHSARHAQRIAALLRSRNVGRVYAVSNCRLGLPVN